MKNSFNKFKKIYELNKVLQLEYDNFLNLEITNRQEIIKKEVAEIISNNNRTKFLKYVDGYLQELLYLDNTAYPQTYDACAKSFNEMLRLFINDERYKGYLLSGKIGSGMDSLRNEIVQSFFDIVDKDIIDLLSTNLELKTEDSCILEDLPDDDLSDDIYLEETYDEAEDDPDHIDYMG